jgi:hypothetical protein
MKVTICDKCGKQKGEFADGWWIIQETKYGEFPDNWKNFDFCSNCWPELIVGQSLIKPSSQPTAK